MDDSTNKVCGSCGQDGLLLKCGGCKSIWYCDVKCQKKDWKRHKSTCRKLKIPQGRPKEIGMGKISGAGKDENIVKVFPVTVEDKCAKMSGHVSTLIETNYRTGTLNVRNLHKAVLLLGSCLLFFQIC